MIPTKQLILNMKKVLALEEVTERMATVPNLY